jgi:hypothetical protein
MAKSMKKSVTQSDWPNKKKKRKKKPNDLIVGFYLNFIMRFPRLGFTGRVASCK